MFTEQLTQALAIPQPSIPPANYAASNNMLLGPIDMSLFRRLWAHVILGVNSNATAGNVQAIFQASNTSGGTYANVPNPNTNANVILTLNTSNSEGTLEVRADQLPAGNRYVKLSVTVNGNACFYSAAAYGGEAEYKPAQQYTNTNTGAGFNIQASQLVT